MPREPVSFAGPGWGVIPLASPLNGCLERGCALLCRTDGPGPDWWLEHGPGPRDALHLPGGLSSPEARRRNEPRIAAFVARLHDQEDAD